MVGDVATAPSGAAQRRPGSHAYLTRGARRRLTRLAPAPQAVLWQAFLRVGHQVLEQGERADVPLGWSHGTWPGRRYPQQCYAKTFAYVRGHADIAGVQLVHGVISHPEQHMPLGHAWVDLPGGIIFDGVVQAFFTHDSYMAVLSAVALDHYSAAESQQQQAAAGHPGPWTMHWVPTQAQLLGYAAAIGSRRDVRATVSRA